MNKLWRMLSAGIFGVFFIGCGSSEKPGNNEGESIKILESVDIDSVTSDFPVGFASVFINDWQFIAYYNKTRNMTIASRMVPGGDWQYKILPTRVGWDSHNSIKMTIDRNDCIHVTGNMHVDSLYYYISREPFDIQTLERIFPLVSIDDELHCTYPDFRKDKDDNLIFSYRTGGSGNGYNLMNLYDDKLRKFKRLVDQPLFDGLGEMSSYFSGPGLGPDGNYHLTWLWRDTPGCETNHDLSYARSADFIHWKALGEDSIHVPITPLENLFTVDPVPAKGGAINGNFRLFFDENMKPFIAYLRYDKAGNSQIYIAGSREGKWISRKVSDWDYRWEFSGSGSITFEIQVGRAGFSPEGHVMVSYSHVKKGKGELLVDGKTFDLIEDRAVTEERTSPYPSELMKPLSGIEGMSVRWMRTMDGDNPGEYYALRWETQGKRRFYEPPETPVPPTILTLYKLKASNRQ